MFAFFFEDIGEFKTKDIAQRKPLIALELYETSKKILQYYPNYDTDISPLKDLYIATMLDPRLKKGIFRILKLPVAAAMTAEEYFYKVFLRYREEMEKEGCVIKRRKGSTVKNCNAEDDLFFFPESQLYDEGDDDEAEAWRYFAEELSHPTASIRDYYQKLKDTFPTIYRMGKDYLSMTAMSAPSESLFSRVKYIVTDKRNRLQPNTIKMLAVLQARDIVGDQESVYFDGMEDLEENKKKDLDDSMPIHTSVLQSSGGVGAVESPDITPVQDSIDVSELESLGGSFIQNSIIVNESDSSDNGFVEDSDTSEEEEMG